MTEERTTVADLRKNSVNGKWDMSHDGEIIHSFGQAAWSYRKFRTSLRVTDRGILTMNIHKEDGTIDVFDPNVKRPRGRKLGSGTPKPKMVSFAKLNKMSDDEKQNLVTHTVTLVGNGELKGQEKTGELLGQNKKVLEVAVETKDGVSYVIEFEKKTLNQKDPSNPNYSWSIDKDSLLEPVETKVA